jgi:hypothetical protein
MVIFHSYVSSAEGIWIVINSIQSARSARFLRETIWQSEVDSIYVCLWESGELGILAPENCGELAHELFPIGSLVLLYMVLHGSHHIPSIHPSHVSSFLPAPWILWVWIFRILLMQKFMQKFHYKGLRWFRTSPRKMLKSNAAERLSARCLDQWFSFNRMDHHGS